jgi:hypothetical protein
MEKNPALQINPAVEKTNLIISFLIGIRLHNKTEYQIKNDSIL